LADFHIFIKNSDILIKKYLTINLKVAHNKSPVKSQTRWEAGTESHGSFRDSRVAWIKGGAAFFLWQFWSR
jgi:hypothetical protein